MPARIPLRARLRVAMATIVAGALASCGGQAVDVRNACPDLDAAAEVPRCTSLFRAGVALRAPTGSPGAPVGAITRGGGHFVTSSGKTFRTEPLTQAPVNFDTAYANTVYQAKIVDGVATELKPVLHVSENALLTSSFGSHVLVGRISARLPDGTYAADPTLPVAIQLDPRARRHVLRGTIANAVQGVRVGDGGCLKPLTGSANPLVDGFTPRIAIARVPSMHIPYGDQLVLEWSESSSGMGQDFYPSVATAMGRDPLGRTWEVVQHGVPNSGPALELRLTRGRISTC